MLHRVSCLVLVYCCVLLSHTNFSSINLHAIDPIIFPGTVAENIAMGKPADGTPPTREEVEEAAKMACAHDFILNLPNGYDTYYGGSSVQLSGGQMQRISIARALIRNPKLTLTSHL